jgi:hypothetical protein
VRLLPGLLLGLTLLGIFVRDLTVREAPAASEEEEASLPEPAIDPEPRVSLVSIPQVFQFGLVTAQEKDDNGNPKKLTFMARTKGRDGAEDLRLTSFAAIRIDGRSYNPGEWAMIRGKLGGKAKGVERTDKTWIPYPGKWAEKPVNLSKDATGQHGGERSAWIWDKYKVRFTQVVEIIAGQPDPTTDKRHLDTCLVQFILKNEDDKPHRVGLRFLLDTYIGANDGVPFYVPRKDNPLIQTQEDFTRNIPDYIQALEYPQLKKPGTVAQVSLKVGGGLEPPQHVSLTHYIRSIPNKVDDEVQVVYDVPMASIRGNPSSTDLDQQKEDSAVALYWEDKELKPGEERRLGFAYGLGHLAVGEGGKLAVTPPTSVRQGEDFPLTALVSDPVEGQTVELVLGRSLQLVDGSAKQAVPPAEAGGNSSVTWRIKADKAGTFRLWVRSSTGEKRELKVVVTPRDSIFK